jgi:hypothetical protein
MFTSMIETPKSSMTFKCFNAEGWCPNEIAEKLAEDAILHNLQMGTMGFHDIQVSGSVLKGCFSSIVPFEVEFFLKGKNASYVLKRLETCEFIIAEGYGLVFGNTRQFRLLRAHFEWVIKKSVNFYSFELEEMHRLKSSMREVKSIALTNPSEHEVRQVKMSGKLEDYSAYNIIDYRNHGVSGLSGVVEIEDELLGRVLANVAVKKNGSIKIGIKGGEMPYSCVLHVLKLLLGN